MLIKDTKVYAVLSKFDKYEQNRCRKYIQSPYFNSSIQLNQLYDLIIKDLNSPSKKPLQKEVLWKKIHKDRGYDDVRFRKYISNLLKLIEGYLAQQFYDSNPLTSAANLIKAVERKKITDLYTSSIRNAKYKSKNNYSLSADYYFHQYWIESYSYEVLDYELNREKKTNYENIMNNLDQFYFTEKVKIYSNILSRKRMATYDYKINFTEEVLKYISENLDKVAPNVEIYFRIYLTYSDIDNTDNYRILKGLLSKASPDLLKEEAYHIYMQLVNYCVKIVRSGNNDFVSEMFDLYKEMIIKELIYENGILDPLLFKNIISVSARLKEFEWAENFIVTNKEKLPESQRENMVTFNLSMLSFMQKKYDKVITLLRDVEYSDISLSLQSKTMLLMTYYDTDELDPLDFLLESFRVYLNRHKEIPKHRVDYHKNLIKFTKKLTKVIPGDKAAVVKIKQEIEETEGFRVKWLEEKIAELEN